MKKYFKLTAILLALLFVIPFSGCKLISSLLNPGESTAPTTPTDDPATQAPAADFNRELLGDWYGVFFISDADGKYKPNAGVKNDCVMRVSADETGSGTAYAVVNGVGELFESVSAKAEKDSLVLTGAVFGRNIEWKLDLMGKKLVMSELFGEGSDYMRVGMKLMHCGEEWTDDAPAGYEFTVKHGFGDLVTIMGGDKNKLPAISAEGVNQKLTIDVDPGPAETPAPGFRDEGRVTSEGGNFSVVLPEGFTVAVNNEFQFILTNTDSGVVSVSFTVTESNEDPLEKLINDPTQWSVSKGYFVHFTIDGFDCYAAAVHAEDSSANSRILLYGTDGTYFLTVEYVVATDVMRAWAIIDDTPEGVPESWFRTLVLGALINGRGE